MQQKLKETTKKMKETTQKMKETTQQSLHNIKETVTHPKVPQVFHKQEPATSAETPVQDEGKSTPQEDECNANGTREIQPEDTGPSNHSREPLWVEIVSCRNLLSADRTGKSDPYVKVKHNGKDLHETKHILQDLNPTYGPETDFSFVFRPPDDSDAALVFKCKDWDRIGKNDELGQVEVPLTRLYREAASKTDFEIPIPPPKGKGNVDGGTMTLRCRPVTQEELEADKDQQSHRNFLTKLPQIPTMTKTEPAGEPLSLFIEIVSCRELLAADKTGSSDPYVKVKFGSKDIHETDPRRQTLNPVYSEEMNSSFVFDTTDKELKDNKGLVFKCKDWDRVGKNDELGQVRVSPEVLLEATGEDLELELTPPTGHEDEKAGFITVRCRSATEEDRKPKSGIFQRFGLRGSDGTREVNGINDLGLLIEIVSCWGLPKADMNSTDPYVKVYIRDKNIHETKPISNTLDPIYTVETGSLFILDANTDDLKKAGSVLFKVKDHDAGGLRNDEVCTTKVPVETLLESKGERMEFKLHPASWVKGDNAGHIAIRCRPVTSYDREFLAHVNDSDSMFLSSKKGDFMDIDQGFKQVMKTAGGTNTAKGMLQKRKKKDNGVVRYLVRPHSDPTRKSATKWMTKEEIHGEALKESQKWLDIGSGSLGRVYVEIIGADGLPDKDVSLGTGNKTDPFVSIVYEDCAVKTDIVDDCLSPRWLPWMQRAFIFRMMHSSSNLHVAVFDYDSGSSNDICGRVSIDLTNLRPQTEYLLTYNLYESSAIESREAKGTLTLRVRMDLKNERSRMISSLGVPPVVHFNVQKPKDFDTIRQTVDGRHDLKAYSKKTIQLYVDELKSHQYVQFVINDAVVSLLFWRGQVRLCKNFWVPFYSFVLFLTMILLAEFPWLFPSFLCFGISWILLAVQNHRNNTPNPWDQTKSFASLLLALIVGSPLTGPHSIEAHQNEEESNVYEEKIKKRIQKAKEDEERLQKEQMALLDEHQDTMANVGDQTADTNIATQSGGVSIDPFKSVLYPIQQILAKVCTGLRLAKNIVKWNEPYYAFFLTFAFILLGLVFLVTPWGFILKWTGRIIAWGVFGPHMKLVDIFWYSKIDRSDEARTLRLKEEYKKQVDQAKGTAATAREQRERALKLQANKKVLFGKYVTNIPVLRLERYTDVPLHTSIAKPFKISESPLATMENVVRVSGQQLVGDMIPKILSKDETEIGEAKASDVENQNGDKTKSKSQSEAPSVVEASEKTPLIKTTSSTAGKKKGFLSGLFSSKG